MTGNFRVGFVATVAVFACVAAGRVSAAAPVAPEAIARAYFSTLKERGLASVAEFMHPDELLRFKTMMLPFFQAEAEAGKHDLLAGLFGAKATLADVENASPSAFMRKFLAPMAQQMSEAGAGFDRVEIVGSVREGELAHVVARIHVGVGEMAVTQMDVISLKPMEGSWGLMLTGQMEGLARALRGAGKGGD